MSVLRKMGAAAAVTGLLALGVNVAPAAADVTGSVTVSPASPVAFSAYEIEIDATGCTPGTPATVQLSVLQLGMFQVIPSEVSITTDGSGSVSTTFSDDLAIPGRWAVSVICDSPVIERRAYLLDEFDVALPADFRASVTPTQFTAGAPFAATLTGTGCPGDVVEWSLQDDSFARPPVAFAVGTTPVDGSGSWSVQTSGTVQNLYPTVPTDDPFPIGPGFALISCDLPDGVPVFYPLVDLTVVAPSSPTTAAVSDPGGSVATPRFAG